MHRAPSSSLRSRRRELVASSCSAARACFASPHQQLTPPLAISRAQAAITLDLLLSGSAPVSVEDGPVYAQLADVQVLHLRRCSRHLFVVGGKEHSINTVLISHLVDSLQVCTCQGARVSRPDLKVLLGAPMAPGA